MLRRVNIAHITFIVLAFGNLAQGTAPQAAEAGAPPEPWVVRGDKLTEPRFESLPDTAVIDFGGQRITKAQLRVKAAKREEAMAKDRIVARRIDVQSAQRRIQFKQQQNAEIQADKAKAMAEFTRQSQAGPTPQARQLEAIQAEAAELFKRSQNGSPTEQVRIEKRASELLQQLQHMDR